MQKATLYQRLEVRNCRTNEQKIAIWQKFGFTKEEAEGMIRGRTNNQACEEIGGVWTVGNVRWSQAINKEHAQKLHIWNFGEIEETHLIRTDSQGLDWVIE